MTDNNYGLKEDLALLKDDELRKIVYLESSEYEQDAIDRAKKELFNRSSRDIWESNNIIFKDLFKYSNTDDVIASFLTLFPEENDKIKEYDKLLDYLIIVTEDLKDKPASDISIFIDDECKSFSNKNFNVFGREQNTNEIISLDYIYKTEWLNFRVLKEQLQKFGIDKYIAYCLRAMTAVGFSDDEIEGKFYSIERQDSINNLQKLYPSMKDDNSGTFIMDGLPLSKKYDTSNGYSNFNDVSQVRPWVRYFARFIDYGIWVYFLNILLISLIPNIYTTYFITQNVLLKYVVNSLYYFLWIFVEAFLLSKFGYTLGKWILKVKVTDKYGQELTYINALKRATGVFVFGTAMEIPILTMLASIISYTKLKENGVTKWDQDGETRVIHGDLSALRVVIIVLIFIVPTILSVVRNYYR